MTPDVNVLVASSRADHPHHVVAREWLEDALAACAHGGRFTVLPMVAAGFLRIVTHPRVFARPTPGPQALEFLRAVVSVPGVELQELGAEWPMVERLCEEYEVKGNDVSDVWIAAATRYGNERLATFDRGFRRFLSVRELTVLKV